MRPAFSVVLLTTLIGVGQGLFIALFGVEVAGMLGWLPPQRPVFFVAGSLAVTAFLGAGLGASFFHLGRPERAWRAAASWRTSWLSREVIVLPLFMAAVAGYGALHYVGAGGTALIGAAGVILCAALFLCTGMIYACIRFLQEWATPLTVVNFILLGSASGFTFATAYSVVAAPSMVPVYAVLAGILTTLALCGRASALLRNRRIAARSTLQTAIGIKHPRIEQKSQGFMGGSFNTREFMHGRDAAFVGAVKWSALAAGFVLPLALLGASVATESSALAVAAFVVQYGGLVAERWHFFADARHPQNLYYQTIS